MVNDEDSGQVVKNDKNLPDFTQVKNQDLEVEKPKPVDEDISVNNQDLPEELQLDDKELIEEPAPLDKSISEDMAVSGISETGAPATTAAETPIAPPVPEAAAVVPATNETVQPEVAAQPVSNVQTPSPEVAPLEPIQPTNVPTGVVQSSAAAIVESNSTMPAEMKHWSWGAFSLTWIWALANKTYIGLIALLGPLALPMAIILGIKGNEWAWNNRKWASVDEFKKTQGAWAKWGVILLIFSLIIYIFMIVFVISLFTSNTTTTTNNTYYY